MSLVLPGNCFFQSIKPMNVQIRAELEASLEGKTRGELVDLIFALTSFDQLLSMRQIAALSSVSERRVHEARKAGAFKDPLFGPGFFCFSSNSLRVSAHAANAWRRSFFVPVPITGHKKDGLASEMGLGGKKIAQKREYTVCESLASERALIGKLSPAFLAGNGAK